MDKQVIIVGSGAAGLAAGYWCAELGLPALLLERSDEPGGQLLWTFNPIGNYLGAGVLSGRELRDLMAAQVGAAGSSLQIRTGTDVRRVDLSEKSIELADGAVLFADALIIATGIRRRKLNVKGEADFAGKGMLVSGAREKETVRDQDICIIGGGDAAFENALMLAETAQSVTLVHRGEHFRAREEFTAKVKNDPRIKILTGTVVTEIEGKENVEAVRLWDKSAEQTFTIPAQAVLIRIGVEPNTELFQGQIELDEKGFIAVNNRCETSVENVYAVGDAASPHSMTINTAAGMGATAANVISGKFGEK